MGGGDRLDRLAGRKVGKRGERGGRVGRALKPFPSGSGGGISGEGGGFDMLSIWAKGIRELLKTKKAFSLQEMGKKKRKGVGGGKIVVGGITQKAGMHCGPVGRRVKRRKGILPFLWKRGTNRGGGGLKSDGDAFETKGVSVKKSHTGKIKKHLRKR